MEITTRPRPGRGGRTLKRALLLLAVLLTVGLLTPGAFGLQRHVIAEHGPDDAPGRGSLVFDDVVPVEDLRRGDLVVLQPPTASGRDDLVTRRIVEIHHDHLVTSGGAGTDLWRVPMHGTEQSRVELVVPWAGYAWLLLVWLSPAAGVLIVLGVVAVATLRVRSRRAGRTGGGSAATGAGRVGVPESSVSLG